MSGPNADSQLIAELATDYQQMTTAVTTLEQGYHNLQLQVNTPSALTSLSADDRATITGMIQSTLQATKDAVAAVAGGTAGDTTGGAAATPPADPGAAPAAT